MHAGTTDGTCLQVANALPLEYSLLIGTNFGIDLCMNGS